jgi:predicted DCC family thiol-disulfide oxidoreductase YuxK
MSHQSNDTWVSRTRQWGADSSEEEIARVRTMADVPDSKSQVCLLVYDGQCRLCVAAKTGLERLTTHTEATSPVRMVPYQSEEAKQALGESYRPGRPNVAFLVRPHGEISSGLDAFLPLLPGLKGGRALSVLLSFPLVKPFGYLLYWFVARYRYFLFGKVPLSEAAENPDRRSGEIPQK